MANIFERFGILNASKIILFDKSTGKAVLKIPQANSISLEIKSDSKTAKEQGMDAITWNLAKTGELKINSETTSFAQLAEMLGSNGLKLNATNETYVKTETFTVTTAGTLVLSLSSAPLANSVVSFNTLTEGGDLLKELVGVVDGSNPKKFTITDARLLVGDTVEVNYIDSISAGGVYTFKVSGIGSRKPSRKLIANVLRTNGADNSLEMMQLEVPNVLPENAMTLTFDAENPSKFEFTLKIMKDSMLTDENGDPLFFALKSLNPNPLATVNDLAVTATVATKADATFSAVNSASTNIQMMYKLSTDADFSPVAVGGTTGVRIASALTTSSTSAQVSGLTSASKYDFKLSYVVDGITYTSNVVSNILIP